MRKMVILAAVLVAACSANPTPAQPIEGGPPRPIPVHGVTPGHLCSTAGTDKFIGRAGTGRNGRAIKRESRAAVLRWAPPGYMLTMDYREDRVTIYLGPGRKITQIKCG